MFGFFSKKQPNCPLSEDNRLWIEHAFIWLAQEFGEEKLKQKPFIFPDTRFFPFAYDGSKNSVEHTAEIVARQMDIDMNEVNLHVYAEGMQKVDGSRIYVQSDEKSGLAAGKYLGKDEDTGKYNILIEEKSLRDPERMVAVLAHEFAHIKLLGDKIIDENDEHLTDLLTVVYGLGIFNAIVAFREYTTTNSWGWSSIGYLKQQEWGYALALYTYYHDIKDGSWKKFLPLNIKADVQKSEEYINANTNIIFKQAYAPDTSASDKLFTGTWRGYFTYGKNYPAALQHGVFHFTINMTVAKGILYGHCNEDSPVEKFKNPSVIEGIVENGTVTFIKTYFVKEQPVNDDAVDTNAWPMVKIKYTGQFDGAELDGIWEIRSIRPDKDGAHYEHVDSGAWMMKKLSP